MHYIESNGYSLEIGDLTESSFSQLLSGKYTESKKVIIVDENTSANCLDYLITNFEALSEAEVIQLPAGEESKQMELALNVLEALTEYEVTRYDLIINLGGGVITDFGGFVASIYKRGCDFVNIPTSLLAMVDASIGGKTGLNLGQYKNQLGVFAHPVGLYIDSAFLETLPEEELASGLAEMLKHGLIADADLYHQLATIMREGGVIEDDLIVRCIEVKNRVVCEDPMERGLRKILNYGHTIGHALEGHFMHSQKLSHGHAVAIGMVMEAYLSLKSCGLSQQEFVQLEEFLLSYYPLPKFSDEDIQSMMELLQNDKKNRDGKIMFSLLPKIGECKYDQIIRQELVLEVFMHYKNMQLNLN